MTWESSWGNKDPRNCLTWVFRKVGSCHRTEVWARSHSPPWGTARPIFLDHLHQKKGCSILTGVRRVPLRWQQWSGGETLGKVYLRKGKLDMLMTASGASGKDSQRWLFGFDLISWGCCSLRSTRLRVSEGSEIVSLVETYKSQLFKVSVK